MIYAHILFNVDNGALMIALCLASFIAHLLLKGGAVRAQARRECIYDWAEEADE